MLAREDFASELFGSQHRVTGITGDLTGGVLRALQSCSPHLRSPPASFHLHSPWQRAGVLLVVYFTAQRCSALPRNSSSEQERPVRSAVLIWSSSAGHTPQRPWPLRRTPTAWNDRARPLRNLSRLTARAVRADRSNIGTLIHGNQRYP